MNSSILDKSDSHVLTKLFITSQVVAQETGDQFVQLQKNFLDSPHFARLLKQNGLMQMLEHAGEGQESQALNALLLAFFYPGSRKGILGVIRGLFGSDAEIRVIEERGVLALEIVGANASFIHGFTTIGSPHHAVTDKDGRWIVFRVFNSLGNNDLRAFLFPLLPVGVVCEVRILSDSPHSPQ